MKYQNLKVRDAGRLAIIGLVGVAVGLLAVSYARAVEAIVGRRCQEMLVGLGIGGLLSLGGSVWYLFTSPEQNARFVERAIQMRAKGAPAELDTSLFDASDPSYRIMTIVYLLRRITRRAAD
jgi:hypothetical protein